jgi:HSP20 family molecular chaperone IbpA
MSFFYPRTIYHTEASLGPIFQLLSQLDSYPQRRSGCPAAQRRAARPWQPRFELGETADAFVIHGEVAGLNQEHVTIDLVSPQKLVISGKSSASAAPAAQQSSEDVTAASDAGSEKTLQSDSSRSSHQATVEDDDEADDFEVVGRTSEKSEKQQEKQPAVVQEPEKTTEDNTARRNIEFTRAFKFSYDVDYEATTASLHDGLLTVVVPKPVKPEPRRIVIN